MCPTKYMYARLSPRRKRGDPKEHPYRELFVLQVTTYWLRDRIPENRPCLIGIVALCVSLFYICIQVYITCIVYIVHSTYIEHVSAIEFSACWHKTMFLHNGCEPDLIYRKPLDPYILYIFKQIPQYVRRGANTLLTNDTRAAHSARWEAKRHGPRWCRTRCGPSVC